MKTSMTISLDVDLKEQFTQFAEDLETNPTNLLNMMMKQVLREGEFHFSVEKEEGKNDNRHEKREFKSMNTLVA